MVHFLDLLRSVWKRRMFLILSFMASSRFCCLQRLHCSVWRIREADKLVINNMCMLLTISFIMLTRISYQKSIRQFIIVAVSLIIGLFIPFLVSKLKFLKHLTWIYGMVGVFALLVVAVLGSVTHGSKISYSINGFTFQPSEFVKILFVFFIAGLLTESKSLGQVVISAVAAAAHVIILVFSKDLGSAVIFLQAI